jgi:hypothetical protein
MAEISFLPGPPFQDDPDHIATMEADLIQKATAAFTAANVSHLAAGVFDLDDLERKTADSLGGSIGVGVSYNGRKWAEIEIDFKSGRSPTNDGSRAAKMLAYSFLVILAVPTGQDCEERYNATKLLAVLSRSIHGSSLGGDLTARRWNFMSEQPHPDQSTDNMLYYTQVWQANLPLTSGPQQA